MSLTALPDRLSDAARAFAAREHELLIGGELAPAADGRTVLVARALDVCSASRRGCSRVLPSPSEKKSVKGSSTSSSPSARRGTYLRTIIPLLGALGMALAQGAQAAPLARTHGCQDANVSARIAPLEAMRTAVVCLVNRERRADNLPPLRQSRALDRSAQRWTRTMVQADVFSHGANFATRITQAGVRWSDAGENIATGFATPRDVVNAWMSSTGHCRNILDPNFRLVGVGADPHPVRGSASGPATWTEDFALPAGAQPPSRNWGPANGCPY